MNLGSFLQRASVALLPLFAFSQSVPPLFPDRPFDPNEFAHLTATRSDQMPPSLIRGARRDQLQRIAEWVPPASYSLPRLERRSRQTHPISGQPAIGEARSLPADLKQSWHSSKLLGKGTIWRLRIHSPGAKALRLHFDNFDIGDGKLWIYPDAERVSPPAILGPYTGKGTFGDGEFWTGSIFSDSAVLEILLDAKSDGADLDLPHIDRVLHIYPETDVPPVMEGEIGKRTPSILLMDNNLNEMTPNDVIGATGVRGREAGSPNQITVIQAASCHADATCFPQYSSLSAATLHFTVISGTSGYSCSGSLINTRTNSLKPYVTTADHCVSNDLEARSVEAYFNYASTSCNRNPVDRDLAHRVFGARYLAGGGMSAGDFALMLLNASPPPGSIFLGWNASEMPFGERFIGVHHPRGSWRRLSIGMRAADRPANVEGQEAPTSAYFQLSFTTGLTEGGSSGSPIMSESGQLYGTLSYGPGGLDACLAAQAPRGYGRFSRAYPVFRPFLEDEAPPSLTSSLNRIDFQSNGTSIVGQSNFTTTLSTNSVTPISFQTSSSSPWILVSPRNGQASAALPARLTITVDPRYFNTSGLRRGSVQISAGTLVPLSIDVSMNVSILDSNVLLSLSPNPVVEAAPDADGYNFFFSINLAETAGISTSITSLVIDGQNYNSSVANFFGSTSLNAFGTLTAPLRSRGVIAPTIRTFSVGGVDTASRRPWTRTVTVPFNAKPRSGHLSLSSFPNEVQERRDDPNCPWLHYLVVTETNGYPVRLTKLVLDDDDVSAKINEWFDQTNIPEQGSAVAGVCWSGVRAPDSIPFEVGGIDSLGNPLSVKGSFRFVGRLVNPASLTLNTRDISLRAQPNGASTPTSVAVGFSGTGQWRVRTVLGTKEKNWLTVSPLSGAGPVTMNVSASAAGMSAGTYRAKIFVESSQAEPQLLLVPVTLVVGAAAPAPQLSSGGVVHNASYRGSLTRGALATAFGANLVVGEASVATQVPLPWRLGSTSLTVNGRPAPLLYAGPSQVNFQVPWETESGTATLVIDVGGQRSQTTFQVVAANPGIYTSDGRTLVPSGSATRGAVILAFVTGIGQVTPLIGTGMAPDASFAITNLPTPAGVSATIGGVPARVYFSAIPYGLVGVMQMNIEVPATAPLGDQPLVVTIAGVASPPAYVTLR